MRGLSDNHKEILRDLVESEQWKAVIAYCDLVTQRHAEAVVNYNLERGPRGLTILKANLDGARAVCAALTDAKRVLKIKD